MHFAKGSDDIAADAADIGNGRVGADPDALIDTASQMFHELAVDIGVYDRTGLVGVHDQSCIARWTG